MKIPATAARRPVRYEFSRSHIGLTGLMESLALAHLSDIHFTRGANDVHDADRGIRNEVIRDIEQMKREVGALKSVLVTGDIAFSGKKMEYDRADEWLRRVCAAGGCSEKDVAVVPGNHDVDRSIAGRQVTKLIHDAMRSPQSRNVGSQLAGYFSDPDSSRLVLAPLAEYNTFARKYGCDMTAERPHWERYLIMSCGTKIKMRGLCSVFVSNGGDAKGNMVIGDASVDVDRDDGALHLTMCHHPPEWLVNQDLVEDHLNSKVHIQLFGHKHAQRLREIDSKVRLVAGATNPDRREPEWVPTYNILQISRRDDDIVILRVWQRCWHQSETKFVAERGVGAKGFRELEFRVPSPGRSAAAQWNAKPSVDRQRSWPAVSWHVVRAQAFPKRDLGVQPDAREPLVARALALGVPRMDAEYMDCLSSMAVSDDAGSIYRIVHDLVASHLPTGKEGKKGLRELCRAAFSITAGRPRANRENDRNIKLLDNPLVRDYLVASHVVQAYVDRRKSSRASGPETARIYPNTVNYFVKCLLTAEIEPLVSKAVRSLLERNTRSGFSDLGSTDLKRLTHAAYLAGRLTSPQIRESMTQCLREALSVATVAFGRPDRERLLFVRSLYISLAYLGDESALDGYVSHVLSDFEWDDLNRGFHLEYYGDQPFHNEAPMVSADELKDCPHTFSALSSQLRQKRGSSAAIQIAAMTLASLGYQRHAARTLDSADREALAITLQAALGTLRPDLQTFVRVCLECLKSDDPQPGNMILECWNAKHQLRQGWLDRKSRRVETVGSHTFGALALGVLLLPEFANAADGNHYSKSEILRLVLVHDFAEGRLGDIAGPKKTEEDRAKELSFMTELSYIDSHHPTASFPPHPRQHPDLRWIAKAFLQFESEPPATLNAKVAKDLDRLDLIMEALSLIRDGDEGDAGIAPYAKMVNQAIGGIATPYGQSILERFVRRISGFGAILARLRSVRDP